MLLARRTARRVAGCIILEVVLRLGWHLFGGLSVYPESFDRFGRGGEMT